MPRIEAYRCRFTGQIFTNRLEWSNHLLFQRDVERERRDARKTNIDPEYLNGLWMQMREECTTFQEISAFVLKYPREFGYFFAHKTKDFQRKYGDGQKVINWPTVRQFEFVHTDYHDNILIAVNPDHAIKGWKPSLKYDIDHCAVEYSENIFAETPLWVTRHNYGLDFVELIMSTEAWPGLCGPVAIEILSRSMQEA